MLCICTTWLQSKIILVQRSSFFAIIHFKKLIVELTPSDQTKIRTYLTSLHHFIWWTSSRKRFLGDNPIFNFASHFCVTILRRIFASLFCVTILRHNFTSQFCVTFLRIMSCFCVTKRKLIHLRFYNMGLCIGG